VGARMQNQSTSKAQRNARALRRGMTDSERKLWYGLRGDQLGVKFRRQHPLGHYVADFACLGPKLIVELDGSQHTDQAAYDARRDQFFQEHGFAVLRFPTNAPLTNLEGVRTEILEQLKALVARAPTPDPPPGGEGVNTQETPK
jgi:very-short-patch-repair endonuclease